MPSPIDADARRHTIARLAARLVATNGAHNISLRSLAAAAGASTTVITHYFANKADVLEAAYRASVDEARERVEAVHEDDDRRVLLLCEAVLPLDEPRRMNWLTWIAFMGTAISEPRLATLQRRRTTDHRTLVCQAIAAAQDAGRVHPDRDAAEEARALVALVHGIATQAVFHPDDWPQDRQLAPVRAFCDDLSRPPHGEETATRPEGGRGATGR
ncbi:TetR/AcrR family transcriptional regulator [Streptomyces sp. NPDC051985]|uniref:TetR/AcrR family transcriptional regulator n=1 Tax=Streptomyces sp. NPDC051985 TaxID=3155807 RepID=UPI003418FF43